MRRCRITALIHQRQGRVCRSSPKERHMSWKTASGFRTMTKTVVAGAFIAVTAIGVAVPANAQPDLPTGPDDPRCLQYRGYAACQGGPYAAPAATPPSPPSSPSGPPTGPTDPACVSFPGDAACAGSPFLPPSPPPPPPPPPIAPPPIAPIDAGLAFDTFTGGPHVDDMPPIDDTHMDPVMPHIPTGMGMAGMPGHI